MATKQRQKKKTYTDEQLVAFIAAALAMNASPTSTAAELAKPLAIPPGIIAAALLIATSRPIPKPGMLVEQAPSAEGEAAKLEGYFRGLYVLNSSRRINDKVSRGVPTRDALAQEAVFFRQHMEAVKNRAESAKAVDRMARRYGPLLGWHARLDSRTSPECRAANGKNFSPTTRPAIGYPSSVHLYCRCKPGAPFPTSHTVYEVKAA